MVHMLVLSHAPLLSRHLAEEAMNVAVAAFLSLGMELMEKRHDLCLRLLEIRFVFNNEVGTGRAVPAERLLTDEVLEEDPADQFADHRLRHWFLSCCHFQCSRRVFE